MHNGPYKKLLWVTLIAYDLRPAFAWYFFRFQYRIDD
jgi:hypothetical protein